MRILYRHIAVFLTGALLCVGFGCNDDVVVRQGAGGSDVSGSDTPGECGPNAVDSDGDGLRDCTEKTLCAGRGSNPDAKDTDDDGLNDFEEVQAGTSPCEKDSDDDGVDDWEETNWGFDPTDPDTDDDGQPDGEVWIFGACDEFESRPVNTYSSQVGNWKIAVDETVSYTSLSLENPADGVAAASLDHPEEPVAGFVQSHSKTVAVDNFPTWFTDKLTASLAAMGDTDRRQGLRHRPGGRQQILREFSISTEKPRTVAEFREMVQPKISDLTEGDISGYPPDSGETYESFHLRVQAVLRAKTAAGMGTGTSEAERRARPIITGAVYPETKSIPEDWTFLAHDLTSPEELAEFGTPMERRCKRAIIQYNPPALDILLVVDGDGSAEYKNRAAQAVESLRELDRASLAQRFGVTNMQPANSGRLYGSGWFDDSGGLLSAAEDAAFDCNQTADWQCGDSEPHGLQVARSGLDRMLGLEQKEPPDSRAIRPNASLLTVFVTDEPPASVTTSTPVSDYVSFFTGRSTVITVFPGASCEGPASVGGYQNVAEASGGFSVDLCSDEADSFAQDLVFTAGGWRGPFTLDASPVAPSIIARAYGGQRLPRSTKNGFRYFSSPRGIALLGSFQPSEQLAYGGREFIAVRYRAFVRDGG